MKIRFYGNGLEIAQEIFEGVEFVIGCNDRRATWTSQKDNMSAKVTHEIQIDFNKKKFIVDPTQETILGDEKIYG